MSAPLGNRNGQAAWIKTAIPGERQVQVSAKIPTVTKQQIEERLQPGESMSDFIKRAIASELARRAAAENN
ncbi:MAG: hypothetical protein AB4426_11675 [Xenococcaceae cyanobacterium]